MEISSSRITTPVSELTSQIQAAGWILQKVDFDNKENHHFAEAENQHGEQVRKFGPDEGTALGNLLVAVLRHNHMRRPASHHLAMWQADFTPQMEAIAEAYAKAPAYDPKAAPYWRELGQDSMRRMEVLQNHIQMEPTYNPTPYTNAADLHKDIYDRQKYQISLHALDHPVWSGDEHNAFRAVHDILGRGVARAPLGWGGASRSFAAHAPLLTPTAQAALFTETVARPAFRHVFPHVVDIGKIATFPEFFEEHQKANNSPGHRGIHPSQSIIPYKGPSLVAKLAAGEVYADPNKGWQSNVEPGYPNAYMNHGDPLEGDRVMDNASLIDTNWSEFTKPDGTPDRDRMKLAIVNAFRVVLLSPRKDLRWNAIHYQHIASIPGDVTDPKVYWDTLERNRREWNKAMGVDENAHMPYFKFLKPFTTIEWAKHPTMSFQEAQAAAEAKLFTWHTQEQDKIMMEDEDKAEDKQRSADEIERRANEAIARRLKEYINEKKNPETDHYESPQESLFAKVAADPVKISPEDQWLQYLEQQGLPLDTPMPEKLYQAPGKTKPKIDPNQRNVLAPENVGKYGAFMGTHLKSIGKISQHADEIVDAALEDVKNHDGAGHHFRATVLQLGVSGVGPKVCSFAWLLLQPMTSQLATIDTHMMDVLGHNYEKEMNNRDYFKFERELQAGRDAAGYSHIPLGTFQWGMWDYKRTGEGSHQDHSAMRVIDPKPHDQIDWVGKAQNLKGESWHSQAPDWWQNTKDARDAVAQDWTNTVAASHASDKVPYQVLNSQPPVVAKTKMARLREQTGQSTVEIWASASTDEAFSQLLNSNGSPSSWRLE